jgi:hypothetical protein
MSSCQPGIEETDLIEEQVDYWNEGSSIDLQEESRYGTSIDYQNVEKHLIKDVTLLLSKIADKSDRLINNSTTNLNLFVAVFLSHFLSLYSFERTRMAHLTALTSLTLVVLERWCLYPCIAGSYIWATPTLFRFLSC